MTQQKRARHQKQREWSALALTLVLGISACGGGGGSSTSEPANLGAADNLGNPTASEPISAPNVVAAPTAARTQPTPQPAVAESAGKLIISEVATNYYSNDVAWFEIYNTSSAPVALSRYTFNSSTIDRATGANSFSPMSFALPDVMVPAGGFMVIGSKTSDQLQDSANMVYVKNGSMIPFWNANGSIELLRDGVTVDMVRFGSSTAAPTTFDEWAGASVAALPSGADEHGKSIVRLAAAAMADTNTPADWALVNFATPGGPNDVLPGTIDSDLDGIPDSAKLSGGSYAGLDLYAMGARRGRRDVFMEIDYMTSGDLATTPRREALEKMQSVFAAHGIALHMDTGKLYAAGFNPALFNLGGGNAVAFAPCIELDTSTAGAGARAGCSSLQAYKNANFDVRRRFVFHYVLFANSLNTDGGSGPSGIAEMSGNDIIIALGGYGFSTASDAGRNMLINMQAGTLMHEFGHNLGLKHGGNEDLNYKPNHYSIMNYMYQFTGLSATPNSIHAAERYYFANGLKGKTYCGLVENSPCTDSFLMSYSDGSSASLDESRLSEAANIGRGSVNGAYADWDDNGSLTAAVFGRNINPLDSFGRSVLRDYNEWNNLVLPFARGFSGSSSGRSLMAKSSPRVNPMSQRHTREQVREQPLPATLHQAIRNAQGGHHREK